MKPICVPCKKFYRPEKNGAYFEEGMPVDAKHHPGVWKPYKLWQGDLWRCQGCGAEIIVGAGRSPYAEHHEPDYAEQVQAAEPLLLVEDC